MDKKKKWYLLILITGIIMLNVFSFAGAETEEKPEFKVYRCLKTDNPPVVDGKLDDACWQNVEKVSSFTLNTSSKKLAAEQTFASILYDEDSLYFGFECKESEIKSLIAQCTLHDSKVYKDDCIEFFIDTNHDHKSYYHFAVNSLGTKYEAEETDKSWDIIWQAGAAVGKHAWFLEIAIPLKSLKASPKIGDIWGVNLNREHHAGGKFECSCWSNTGHYFHNPERFGHLIFGSYNVYLNKKGSLAQWEKKKNELTELLTSNPEQAKEFQARFDEIKNNMESIKKVLSLRELTTEEFILFYDSLERCGELESELNFSILFK